MTATMRPHLVLLALPFLAIELPAQGRGRGRSEAILERVSCYFTTEKLPAGPDLQARLAAVPSVAAAKEKKELAMLYLFDSSAEAPKREPFENVMFGNEEVGVTLRCFHCARVDIAGETAALTKLGPKLPVFVAFDDSGKSAGEAAFTGYKAAVGPLTTLLEKAAAGHIKQTLAAFASGYRGIVHDLEMLEKERKTLQDRIAREKDDKKKALLEKDAQKLDADEQKLLAAEKDTLEKARIPVRDAAAKRFEVKRGR